MSERPDREEEPDFRRRDRDVAIEGLRSAVAESEASGEAAPFDMDAWVEDQDRLDCSLREGLESGEAVGFDVNEWLEAKRTGSGREEAA
jgi:Arc/MetJ-type ribon-helix-helix transcriptional regulator